jgi:hypothetical protein
MTPNAFGRATEARFIMEATERGMIVSTPFTEAPGYDAVVDNSGKITTVQIKGCRVSRRTSKTSGRWTINIRGSGSWNVLAVYLAEPERWLFYTRRQIPTDLGSLDFTTDGRWTKLSRTWSIFDA